MQIAEIHISSLQQYIASGFLQFNPETGKSMGADVEDSADDTADEVVYTKKDATAYLDEHNISYKKSDKAGVLVALAKKNGLGANSADDVNDTDLDALNDVEGEDVDTDLSALDDVEE